MLKKSIGASLFPGTHKRLRSSSLVVGLVITTAQILPFLSVGVAYAQNSNATIRGQVLDPSGALVPNANVTIVNQATNVQVFSGQTDSSGTFVAPQVIPGTYRVTVEAPGLKTSTVSDLVATVSQVASVNINMQVGVATEVITVVSRGEQLDRSTSNVSTLISPQDVENLPLNQRNVENLLAFVPGVASGGNPTTVNTSQLSINGSRTLNSEILLNGVSTIIASTGSPLQLPSPDGVDELRFLTANAPAEYGRTSGAILAANTRSGTNIYHGTVYTLVRNEAFNANTYFDKLNNRPRGRNRFYQVGASLGGPIWIPHLYDGHNKLFFFVNYDRTLQRVTNTTTLTVPDLAKRAGNFNFPNAPRISNPDTGLPYANQQVTNINPAAAKILSLMPAPNQTGTSDLPNGRNTGNYFQRDNTSPDTLRLVARVDAQIRDRDRLGFNLYRNTSSSPNPVVYQVPLFNTNFDCFCSNAWIGAVDYTRTWTSTLVTDLNMGFFRNAVFRNPPGAGFNAASALGIASLPLDQTPQITMSGYNNIGADGNTNQINITNTFSPYGTVTKTFGPHTFRFGASLRKNQFNSYNPSGSPQGSISFTGDVTSRGAGGNATTALADFLTGSIKTASYQLPMPPTGRRNWNLGIFFEDDYKVTPKLTINAGLRYEYESPIKITGNIYSRFDPDTGFILRAGVNASASLNVQTPKANLSPRIGLAYSINDKTVLRAAFGTFYSTIFQNLGGQIAFPGYDQTQSYNNLGTGLRQPFSLSQGLPLTLTPDLTASFASIPQPTATNRLSNPYQIGGLSFDKLSPMPMVQQWNFGIQRQLPFSVILEVNYVGNHTLHLPYNIPITLVPVSQWDAVAKANTTSATQAVKPFPALSTFSVVRHAGMSNYNSLQITGRRQFNKRIVLLSSYTYAKALDDGSTIYNFSAPGGTANAQYVGIDAFRKLDYAVSNIDIKHRANIALQYTTSGPWWLRGWRIAPAFVGQTGLPINITQSNLIPNVSQQRPNGNVKDILVKPYINGNVLQYFKPVSPAGTPQADTSYPLQPSGPVFNPSRTVQLVQSGLGNVPRDAVRAFGVIQFDASFSKTFDLWRELKFQFRVDAFNVLNHTNFTAPNSSLSVGTELVPGSTTNYVANFRQGSNGFGQITGTQGARQLQLVGRFNF